MDHTVTISRAPLRLRRGRLARPVAGVIGLAAILWALINLLAASAPLERTELDLDGTPATFTVLPDMPPAPLVVVTHGFAGSRQFMEAFTLTLARSGYAVLAFDFMGHGRNAQPMGGDVNSIEGTTRMLMDETARAMSAARALPAVDAEQGVVLLGHSMATDIITREALRNPDVEAVVGISMFSQAVTPTEPARLLMVSGAWEPHLRAFALEAVRSVAPDAEEGSTAVAGDVVRRAVAAPRTEHVAVLYSGVSLREARAFIDDTFGRTSTGPILRHGPWVALLLGGVLLLGWPVLSGVAGWAGARAGYVPAPAPGWRALAVSTLVPALMVPIALSFVDVRILPVLVADYLALHMALFGALQLGLLRAMGHRMPPGPIWPAAVLVLWGIGVFGVAMDQFAAAFAPNGVRLLIIGAVACGAVPYMLGDAQASAGGRAPLAQRLFLRFGFLVSLGLAVALDFEGLFFLVIILPVIVLYYLVYGSMGGWVGRRAGPVAAGLGLGLCLAWALGVSFPLFAGSAG